MYQQKAIELEGSTAVMKEKNKMGWEKKNKDVRINKRESRYINIFLSNTQA